jgi:hypothetical protein
MRFRAAIVILLLLFVSGEAAAQELDFRGIRPHLVKESPRLFSFYIGILPTLGVRDVTSFGKIPNFIDAINGFDIPGEDIQSLPELIGDVNALYRSKFSINSIVLPQIEIGVNSKYFELSFRGGAVNLTNSNVFILEKKIDLFQLVYYPDGTPYLVTDQQKVLHIRSRTLLGGELWGTIKLPIQTPRYKLKLLLGIGGSIGYSYTHEHSIAVAEEFSTYHAFDTETNGSGKVVGDLGLRVGLQLDGYKYLRPRIVLEARGIISHAANAAQMPKPNLGLSLRIWKLATLSASFLDLTNPEVRIEASRGFSSNSEVALGGVFRSKQFKGSFGYLTLSVGGRLVKFTNTLLFEKSQVGLLIGAGLGYWP